MSDLIAIGLVATGVGALGGGLALGVIALYKFGWRLWAEHKARKLWRRRGEERRLEQRRRM